MESQATIFLSAAEASGDEHASHLIRALRERLGDTVRFVGAAGPKMQAAGCESLADLTAQATMLAGPLLKLRYYHRMVRTLQRHIRQIRPDLVIPVDSPALNWHMCKAARQAGSKVMYYIAPQVWAWAPWRVKKLARLTDAVACLLPFEQEYLRRRGVSATFVGHPLLDSLPPRPQPPSDIIGAYGDGSWRVALLLGSRQGEIARHAPAMLQVAADIRSRYDKATCVFCPGTEKAAAQLSAVLGDRLNQPGLEVVVGQTRQQLAQAHFALAVSGTVTLDVSHFGLPMLVFYRVSRCAYNALGRWIIRTPHFSLPNIVAGREIVPEIVPWYGNVGQISHAVLSALDDLGTLVETRSDLIAMMDSLRPPHGQTASQNAADIAAALIGQERSQ